MPRSGSLFARSSYDADASSYDPVPSARAHDDAESDSDAEGRGDMDVLREEEEREKLLSGGDGLFGSIGRKVGNGSIRIGKRVRGVARRKGVSEVVEMMGGKRLGMEEGGEFGIAGSESESELEEEGLLAEKLAFERKPRKPTPRLYLVYTTTLLGFLLLLLLSSLALSHRQYPPTPPPATLSNGTHAFRPTTLLISLDGMRADFLTRHLTPSLSALAAAGVSPRFLTPSFPSVTFPNHWTLVTGLHPESHGIVSNTFFDPSTGKQFHYTDPARSLASHWWHGEPIWATASKAGLLSAVHMWPGSEASTPHPPTYLDHYNSSEPLSSRPNRIFSWLDLPLSQRPQFIAAYVPDIDVAGHKYGPNTTGTDAAITAVDTMLTTLLDGIDSRNLTDIINLVIVSDHGMASTSNDHLIVLEDILDPSLIAHTDGWPLYGLRPHPHVNLTELHELLVAKAAKPDAHWSVYLRDVNMPPRWHFTSSDRIAPLWVVPDVGYAVVTRKEVEATKGEPYSPRGLHGYDNDEPLMRAIFVGRGPAFEGLHGKEVEEFQNIEVYRILCESLGIAEAAGGNNATLGGVNGFRVLEKEESEEAKNDDKEEETKPSEIATITSTPTTSTTATTAFTTTPTPSTTAVPIAEHTLTTTVTAAPSTSTSTESTAADDSDANKAAMDWLEYVKMKAEKLKEALNNWWEGVWVDGGEGVDRR